MQLSATSDLDKEADHARRVDIARKVWAEVRNVSFALEGWIKEEMPVDTGRARASWGNWSPGDLRPGKDGKMNKEAKPGDAIFKMEPIKLSVTQGSNVEYIGALNDGHSQQRGAGFLERLEKKAVDELDARIDAIMRDW